MPYKIPMHPACRRLPWNVNGSWGGHAVRWARRLQGSDARTREAADAQADDGRRSRGDPATSGGSSELFRVAADVPLAAAGRSRCASRSREETQALARTARAAGRMLQAQGLLVRPNACAERNRENATMVRLTADGGERAVFASGLRNTIGFGWHPGSRRMWGLDHGIDWLGDDEQKLHTAHSAPMQLAFYDGAQFPSEFRGDAFAALHGSWNRASPSGYEVVRIRRGRTDGHRPGAHARGSARGARARERRRRTRRGPHAPPPGRARSRCGSRRSRSPAPPRPRSRASTPRRGDEA
jgi:hypothetical protein